jgi:hypothetical protein
MDIPPESGAVLGSILVVVMFAVLLFLQRQSLSNRQQTGIWVVFTILFFSVCSLFFRDTPILVGGARAPIIHATTVELNK